MCFEECLDNVMSSQTRQNGSMPRLSCPMPGCTGVWSDVDLLKILPGHQAEQAYKRRRIDLEAELRRELRNELRNEIQQELAAASQATVAAAGTELRQSLINQALDILVVQCRACGQAFDDFDGCFAISCECSQCICGYCLQTGTAAQIHVHIASNDCYVRRQMHPRALEDTFHQGRSKDEEFSTARRLRI